MKIVMSSTAPNGELKFHIMCIANIILNIIRFISYCIYFALKQTDDKALSFITFKFSDGMILIWVGRKHCNDWERTWVYFTLNCYRTTFNPVETNTVKFYGKIINILVLRHFKFSREKKQTWVTNITIKQHML